MSKIYAVILAGGKGDRMQAETPKAFLQLNRNYIIEYSIHTFSTVDSINEIILVVPEEYINLTNKLIEEKKYSKVKHIVVGGENRFESSRLGLAQINDLKAKVLIHDAARPFVSTEIIQNCLDSLDDFDAVNVLSPISDSLNRLNNQKIVENVNRTHFRQVQTPQGFKFDCIKNAQGIAKKENLQVITDDFSLVHKYNTGSTSWVEGNNLNFKITYKEDLELAQLLARNKHL